MKTVLLLGVLLGTGPAWSVTQKDKPVAVIINNVKGEQVGALNLQQEKDGVRVQVNLQKLKPGTYAVHIHEKGVCEGPEYKTAGDHFNPEHKMHGHEAAGGAHAGDLQNVVVKADGTGEVTELNTHLTLKQGPNSLLKTGGTAIIVHEKADDGKTQPAGAAGKRIACGEIKSPDETKK